jgi:CBS domain-containing membrane protein
MVDKDAEGDSGGSAGQRKAVTNMTRTSSNTDLLVRDVMSRDVVTIARNQVLVVADDVMRLGRIRHLPVLDDDGNVVGVVSQRDLFHSGLVKALGYGARAKERVLETLAVKEAMTTEVVTTTPNTPLRQAAELMLKHKVGCLPVLDEGKLTGILTESDFVALAAR